MIRPSQNHRQTIADPRGSVLNVGRPSSKRGEPIEALLAWAWREELPKTRARMTGGPRERGGWEAAGSYFELLMKIDVNGFGCVPDLSLSLDPHIDALIVAEAVMELADVVLDGPGDDVLSDIAILTEIERAECNARGFVMLADRGLRLPELVARRAMLGGVPTWQSHGEVNRRFVQRGGTRGGGGGSWFRQVMRSAGEGRPEIAIEMDGYDHSTHRPMPGAYQKTELVPDPAELAAERIEYQAYVLALGLLVPDLVGRLERSEPLPPALPLWPWDGERARPAPRIVLERKNALLRA